MPLNNSFFGSISSGISGLKQLFTPSFRSNSEAVGTNNTSSVQHEMSQNDNKNIINNNTERHLPSDNHSSFYNSSNVTSYSPGIQNEPFVHSTPRTVVDNLSNKGDLNNTSCYTNKGDLDRMYGPQTQSKQYKTDITSQDGFKINLSTRKQDTHSYEYYDISDSNVNPHAINHTNKNQNNQQDPYSHNQTIYNRENGLSFSQNRPHTTPTVHFRENTSAQSDTGNFNNSQVHGQDMFAHGNNWGTYGGDKSYNQLREYGNKTVKTNRKLKEPDVFDGQRTEWPDFICHFEQVAQWNNWSESEKAAQLAMSLPGIAQRVLSELTADALCHYDTLKTLLMQRFCPPERETAYRCEFRNRKRNRDETATDYGYALKRLSSRAFPTIPVMMRDSLIVEQYISGLGSAELKRRVQFTHPTTLDRAISLALEFEAFEGAQIYPRKPKDLEELPVLALTNSKREVENRFQENSKIEKLEDSFRDVQLSLKEVIDKIDKTPNRPNNSGRPAHINLRQKKVVNCYHCQKEGHYIRDCPDLQTRGSVSTPSVGSQSQEQSAFNNRQAAGHLNYPVLHTTPTVQPTQI
ncbi:unnamed protein product [Mytilus coruscus]|uniref:CCHC-type domain-containing protein n=1 Tax=Mytilus coruscus TaxID=42192 RepID=A0A6J8B3Z9_MYTCO|nr:unnamed protein product [Mytilus coruscus]